jgi:hypothetical protein
MKPNKKLLTILILLIAFAQFGANAQNTLLRRPISPEKPMWLIHIDTWNYADPQKIIDLIPADIRPYVVMNISLSISHDVATSRFKVAEYGYEIAKSWLRTCAQNQMWVMVQGASGGYCQFSDYDLTVYEEFYRDYPNFLGFNYAEQFWGFDDATDPLSPKWIDRITHFADLLKLSNKYGGYLTVSWCANQWSPSINPIAMLKRNSAFAAACRQYTENFILCEKYTQTSYQSDMESTCLGAYLSGYSGQYGIRYDNTGWTDPSGTNTNFTLATAGAPHLEHIMLTGQTVIDGPEIIWLQCFKENSPNTTTDGFTRRNWSTFARFDNVMVDMFRKILDGTVRIPSRKEVIDRTKLVIVNNVNSSDNNATYSSPQTLFEGLYRMDGDGNYENNKTFFKKTGRYPTIPTAYQLDDADANSFQIKVNRSSYDSRWPSVASKVTELNSIFPQEYTGDLYAGRNENGWVTYNPYKTGKTAKGSIPFKYNTCDSMNLTYSQYTSGVIKEYADKVTFYLCNYDDEVNTGLKADTIWIYGSSSEPTWSYAERGNHQVSVIIKDWTNGVFSLVINHNGALDITVNCSGTGTGRLTTYTTATLTPPEKPAIYTGPRQYEAECFDRMSVSSVVTGGYSGTIRNYTGQGYIQFGTNSAASIRDTVNVLKNGIYKLQTKYSAADGTVTTIDLYVNGAKVATPTFSQTTSESDWTINTQYITLHAGNNSIMFSANAAGVYGLTFDNIVVSHGNGATIYDFTNDLATTSANTPAAQFVTTQSGTAGVVSFTDANSNTSNCFKTYSAGATNGTGVADLDLFPPLATDYYVVWKEYYGTTEGKKGILLRGTGANGSCSFASGMKQGYLFVALNNSDNTVTLLPYIAAAAGLTPQTTYTSSFKVNPNEPCWYRASATGNTLMFECSRDSITWEGGSTATFSDGTYTSGNTELIWGLNTNNFDWQMDNITYLFKNLSVSRYSMDAFGYAQGSGPSTTQFFTVSGKALTDNIVINSPANFEISLSSGSGFASSLTLNQNSGTVASTTIYVRMKSGLLINTYSGQISINCNGIAGSSISLSGTILPQSASKQYNFSNDVATTSAQTPPALNTAIGQGNTATAGVVSYTDVNGVTSNMFEAYSSGNRNLTGVVDLSLFSGKSTNYSVTWKEYVGAAATDYKVGVMVRGDASKIGDATTGYVQGMMQGYLFIVYTAATAGTPHSEFRIYKSTASTSLSMLVNISVTTLVPAAGQPVWYRASASGSASTFLKFEYSTDSITWKTGSSTTDTSTPFTSGATQIVWGLGVGNVNFYMDNITFNGVEDNSGTPVISVSQSSLSGFGYIQESGPSTSQSLTVSGNILADNIVVSAPANFEVSLTSGSGYASSVTLTQSNGTLAEIPIYVRLIAGLTAISYTGDISITSTGATGKIVSLSGSVSPLPVITISTTRLNGFSYSQGSGPSIDQPFTVLGIGLVDNIVVTAPANFEVSLTSGSGYASSVTLTQSNGVLAETPIYVRLIAGLTANNYSGDISITSTGATGKIVSLSGSVALPAITISTITLNGFSYSQGSGPSIDQPFTVLGIGLVDNIVVTAPANFEVSLTSGSGYASSVTLTQSNGTLAETTIYVRLKSNLSANTYSGDISISSTGTISKTISLNGAVTTVTEVKTLSGSSATIISTEYYTLTGQRLFDVNNFQGILIVKKHMSDGTITTSTVWVK